MSDYKLDFNRNDPIFAYSFSFLGDPRMNSEEYKLLMKIANSSKLMDEFQSVVFKHVKEHLKPKDCLFCLIALMW